MNYKLCFSFFLVIILFSCTNEEPVTIPEFSSIPKGKEIVQANNKFAFDIFKEVITDESTENIMISPVSLSLALGMTYNGAESETKIAFESILNYNTIIREEVNEVNKNIIDNITDNSSGSLFEIANSIWIKNSFPVKEDFINLNKQNYYAEVQNLDFSNPNSVNTINNWVADKTYQKIPTIINEISPDEVMFLINALYFNSDWKYSFDEENTIEMPFYGGNTSKNVKMMELEADLDYYSNDTFSSVILPYKNDKYNMTLLLPNASKNINDVVEILDFNSWIECSEQYKQRGISLRLPKFKFAYSKQLKDQLSALGLGNAFTTSANFRGISDIDTYISFILQKTYIDVNEKGTEAAAVTVVGIETTSIGLLSQLTFNKPFLFVITEKETNSICFIGKVGLPDYK